MKILISHGDCTRFIISWKANIKFSLRVLPHFKVGANKTFSFIKRRNVV